jgi:hypothetical protein
MHTVMFIVSAIRLRDNNEIYFLPRRSAPPHKRLW